MDPMQTTAEQYRIVVKVEQLMALVDEFETQLAASRATAAKLLSAPVAGLIAPEEPAAHLVSGGKPETAVPRSVPCL